MSLNKGQSQRKNRLPQPLREIVGSFSASEQQSGSFLPTREGVVQQFWTIPGERVSRGSGRPEDSLARGRIEAHPKRSSWVQTQVGREAHGKRELEMEEN